MSHTSIKGVIDLSDIKESDFNLKISTRFYLHLTSQVRAEPSTYWLHLIPLKEHQLEKSPFWSSWCLDFSSLPRQIPESVSYLHSLSECDFWKFFHLGKFTFRSLANHHIGLTNEEGFEHNDPVMFTDNIRFCLCIWYLRNNECKLTEALHFFNIPTLEEAETYLEEGFHLLNRLLKTYISWPSGVEAERIKSVFGAKFFCEKVLGVIGHRVFRTEKNEILFVQIVSNDKCKIISVNVSYDRRVGVATRTSELFPKIEVLDDDTLLAGNSEYACFSDMHITVPFTVDQIEEMTEGQVKSNNKNFNLLISEVLKLIDACFMEVIARFPRLKNLHRSLPDAIITAFGLHNFCMEHGDIYPDILSQAIETCGPV